MKLQHALAALPFLGVLAGIFFANRVEPYVLGLPFAFSLHDRRVIRRPPAVLHRAGVRRQAVEATRLTPLRLTHAQVAFERRRVTARRPPSPLA